MNKFLQLQLNLIFYDLEKNKKCPDLYFSSVFTSKVHLAKRLEKLSRGSICQSFIHMHHAWASVKAKHYLINLQKYNSGGIAMEWDRIISFLGPMISTLWIREGGGWANQSQNCITVYKRVKMAQDSQSSRVKVMWLQSGRILEENLTRGLVLYLISDAS